MSVGVYTLGLNHVSAPISVRERISLSEDLVKPAVKSLRAAFGVRFMRPPCSRPVIEQRFIARLILKW